MTQTEETNRTVLEIYKMLVEMADRVSQRRQAANNFYLSVNTALMGGSAYLSAFHPAPLAVGILATAGMSVSLLWTRNIESYKELNGGKFEVITEMEKRLPVQPYTEEWKFLHRDSRDDRYRPFHTVEIVVPFVFVAVYAALILLMVPWAQSGEWLEFLSWTFRPFQFFHCLV